jgi:hypothetical protein
MLNRNLSKRLITAAAVAVTLGGAGAAAAEVLVLRAQGPGASRHYRAGTHLPDATLFNLRVGDSLVVLTSGGTRSFRGPGVYSASQNPTPFVMADGRRVRVRAGVVRGEPREEGVQPTEIWDFDSRDSDSLCIAAGARPTLWRPASASAVRVTITAATGASASFDWPAGVARMPWPQELAAVDGGVYSLATDRSRRTVQITTRMLPALAQGDLDRLAAALLAGQCRTQLDTLIATRPDPAAPVMASGATAARSGG